MHIFEVKYGPSGAMCGSCGASVPVPCGAFYVQNCEQRAVEAVSLLRSFLFILALG